MNDIPVTMPATEPLAWEESAHRPAGPALRATIADLVLRPSNFYSRMATDGGLFEPLTFSAALLALVMITAFPAALAQFLVCGPDPAVAPQAYAIAALPARVSGMLLALLPLSVVAGALGLVLAGSLFHVAAKAFGAHHWEGSVSVWLYAAASALVPAVPAALLLLVVSIGGQAVLLKSPDSRQAVVAVVKWSAFGLSVAALLGGLALLATRAAIGCAKSFRLEPTVGASAGLAGVLLNIMVLGLVGWAFLRRGVVMGTCTLAGAMLLAAIICLFGVLAAGRRDASAAPQQPTDEGAK